MKKLLLFAILSTQLLAVGQETWRAMGDDDLNRASRGISSHPGRTPLMVRNGTIYLCNSDAYSQFSIAKFSGVKWEHIDSQLPSGTNAGIDCDIDANEVPYVFFNYQSGSDLPVVKKYVGGDWVDLGSSVRASATTSGVTNLSLGTDNLPRVLYSENGNIIVKQFTGSDWVMISETNEFSPYTSISLSLDKNNVPFVVTNYQVGSTYNCFVKKFNGTNWEEVGITGFDKKGKSLVFDANNVPRLFSGFGVKEFVSGNWVDMPFLSSSGSAVSVAGYGELIMDNEQLFAGYTGMTMSGVPELFIKKFANDTWSLVYEGAYLWTAFTAYNNEIYKYSPTGLNFNYSRIYKGADTASLQLVGPQNYIPNPFNVNSHDFSICNGMAMVSYLDFGDKASIRMYNGDTWNYLGASEISENKVRITKIKSGTDGQIYVAYNNVFSSNVSDTKISVKKWTESGWQLVGPGNFSQSAGAEFDFAVSHNNEPHVLYMNGRVQKFDGTDWVYLGGSAYTGDIKARLALDASDIPYIVYLSSEGITVKKLNGSIWETVGMANPDGLSNLDLPRIAINAANIPYIGFLDSADKIHIKKYNGTSWDPVGAELFDTSAQNRFEMAFDHNDNLHLTYVPTSSTKPNLKKFNGSSWDFVGQPNISPNITFSSKLDFTQDNVPVLVYGSEIGIFAKYFGEENSLAVGEHQIAEFSKIILSPNPATNYFTATGNANIQTIELYDLLGKKLITSHFNGSVDVSSLQSGLYIVRVRTDRGDVSQKIVKK